MHQGLRFCLKSYIEGHRNGQLWSLAEPAQSRPNGLRCQADRFYGLQSRISNKIYSEPMMHALLSCEGPVESNFNFVSSPLSMLWGAFKWTNAPVLLSEILICQNFDHNSWKCTYFQFLILWFLSSSYLWARSWQLLVEAP